MNLNDIFKNLDEGKIREINNFIKSEQGQKMTSNLSQQKKDELFRQFMSLDPEVIKSRLNGISRDDILRFLK